MRLVEVLVLPGASPSSTAITVEVLETANRICRAAGRTVPFGLGLSGPGAENASKFLNQAMVVDNSVPDILIVPGLDLPTEQALADGLQSNHAKAARCRVGRAFGLNAEVASSCSGVFLLASAGLLDGRRATTSWWLAPYFRRLFPKVMLDTDAMVVRDGRLTTAGASMAQLDLMLTIVARTVGLDLAEQCARYLLVEPRDSQARFMAVSFLTTRDDRIGKAEKWARSRLDHTFQVAHLADAAGLSARTFARRLKLITGLSPVAFVQRLRVERAVELLETTRLSLDEISRQVGYADASTLRGLLRRQGVRSARDIRNHATLKDYGKPLG